MKNRMYGYIYRVTNLINGRIYIGQSKFPFKKLYLGSGNLIIQAINKYGRRKFKVEQIASAEDRKELNVLEIYYIKKYRKEYKIYNIASGGTGWSEVAMGNRGNYHPRNKNYKEQQRLRFIVNNPMHRPDVRKKLSIMNKGKIPSFNTLQAAHSSASIIKRERTKRLNRLKKKGIPI